MSIILPYPISGTIASGSLSATTISFVSSLLRMVAIKTTSAGIVYTITIIDADAFEIYKRTDEVGSMSEEVALPMRGVYTVTITNASIDEDIDIKLVIEET